jgi:hypothetical protein
MDSLHERLARLPLTAANSYRFCLARRLAVQAHGFLDRPSEDVDLFTTSAAEDHFPEALATVIAAYKADGLDVYITAENPGFAPLQVTDQTNDATAKVELGIDWRAHPPVSWPSARFSTPTTPSRARSAPCTPKPNPATTSRNGRTPSKVDLAATCGATGAADRRSPGCDTPAHASPGMTPALGCARRGSRAPRRRPSPALAAAHGRRTAPAVP